MKILYAFAGVGVLLAGPECIAAQKIKIEVVEAKQNVIVTGGPKPGSPEKTETRCKTVDKDGEKTQECTTVTTPAVPPSNAPFQTSVSFSAKIILPDGTHAELFCVEFSPGCGKIQSATPERTKRTLNGASETTTNLGIFEAKRERNEMVIYTANGKRKYQIMGSW